MMRTFWKSLLSTFGGGRERYGDSDDYGGEVSMVMAEAMKTIVAMNTIVT